MYTKPERFAVPAMASLVGSARGYFKKPNAQSVEKLNDAALENRGGYKSLLENELDRRDLTYNEREDRDDLDRVRAALYED